MQVFDLLKKKAKEDIRTIVLPEGTDERILTAASKLKDQDIVKLILLGDPDVVLSKAQK